jgi:hypothetical protein
MSGNVGTNIKFDKLQSCFDFANPNCFPGTLGIYNDLATGLRMTAVGTFATSGSGISTAYVSGTGGTYLQIATALATNFTEYTIEAWINPLASSGGGGGIWGHFAGSPTFRGVGLTTSIFGANGGLSLYHGTGTATTIAGFSGFIDYGSWQQLSVSYSNNIATFYKNGSSFGTTSIATPTWTTSLFLRLGNGINNVLTSYGGQIGLCRVWSQAFDSATINYLYTLNKQRYGLP